MSRKKQKEMNLREMDERAVQEINNAIGQCKELKAGDLAKTFSQLDPNTSVYNIDEGEFAFQVPDDFALETCNCANESDPIQHFDNGEYDDSFVANLTKIPHSVYYGDDTDISGYVSDNFELDNAMMDKDITSFIAREQCRMMKDISEIAAAHTAHIIDNLVDYQNAKNKRTKIEVARVVK